MNEVIGKYSNERLLKYLSINCEEAYNNPIDSRKESLRVFITDKNIYLRTGCWSGSPVELLKRKYRYVGSNSHDLVNGLYSNLIYSDYRMTVQYILRIAKMVRREVQG